MPLYEYECAKDGRFELIRKFSDPPVSVCPTCGRKVEKLLSSPAFQFKGTGWYVTDYGKKDSGSSAAKEAKEAKESKESKEASKDGASKESPSNASAKSDKSDSSKPESSAKATPSPKEAASGSSSSK